MSPLFKASSRKTCFLKKLFQSYLRLYRCLFLVCVTLRSLHGFLKLLGAQRCLLVAATTYFSSLSFKLVLKCEKKNPWNVCLLGTWLLNRAVTRIKANCVIIKNSRHSTLSSSGGRVSCLLLQPDIKHNIAHLMAAIFGTCMPYAGSTTFCCKWVKEHLELFKKLIFCPRI